MELAGLQPPVMDWESSNLPDAYEKFERHVKLMLNGPLREKTPEEHASYLLLWIGDKGRDVHGTWNDISAGDAKKPETFYKRFRTHVQPKLNPIFARYKFYNQNQDSGSIDAYVTRLRMCARDCSFADADEMIRDRIVFGTNSSKVREKLINEGAALTLDKALQIAQNMEYSKQQPSSMANSGDRDVHHVGRRRGDSKRAHRRGTHGQPKTSSCPNCGRTHSDSKCPARGQKCQKCKRLNHFQKMCRSKKTVNEVIYESDSNSSNSDNELRILTVNSVGMAELGTIENTSMEQYDRVMNTNVRSMYQLTMLCVPHLVKTKGNIVNVSSVKGMRSFPNVLAYCMSKSATDQFTNCCALDLAAKQIRVNSVNPGVIVTDVHRRMGLNEEQYQKFLEHSKTTHALGRVGQVEEVASVVAFLASDNASYITGAQIPIDGGRHAMCPR